MNPILKRLTTTLGLLATVLLLGACASAPTPTVDFKHDYDFSGVNKIGFYKHSGEVTGDDPMTLSDFQKDRIDNALAQELQKRGLTVVDDPEHADLLLSWHLGTQHKTDVRTYQTPSYGVGYGHYGGYNRYSMYSCWSCTNTDVRVSNYTEGTFIIDMIDPALKKSVWRSVTQSKLKGKRDEDEVGEINEAAARVLGSFPPP
ncbi:DUF4136 domain-containing protein [Seongchinamella sediminis]|uniref:DUF4136 domain-containing protein n=1 Tax=Seongchinamella sediminis TaxID=2283635 RepID=A0A3L7DW62_9GAMM|nr:DUF4136 domain-containing protein [Seongchinamella sediminis]RLQ21015.1 DUF4136 domain-containing protein [Seongchinamella sediminis]